MYRLACGTATARPCAHRSALLNYPQQTACHPIPCAHRSGVYPRPSGVPGSGCRGSAALGGALPSPAAFVHTMKPIWPLHRREEQGSYGEPKQQLLDTTVAVLAAPNRMPARQGAGKLALGEV